MKMKIENLRQDVVVHTILTRMFFFIPSEILKTKKLHSDSMRKKQIVQLIEL